MIRRGRMRVVGNLWLLLALEDRVALDKKCGEHGLLPEDYVEFTRFGPALVEPGALNRKIVCKSSIEDEFALGVAPASCIYDMVSHPTTFTPLFDEHE